MVRPERHTEELEAAAEDEVEDTRVENVVGTGVEEIDTISEELGDTADELEDTATEELEAATDELGVTTSEELEDTAAGVLEETTPEELEIAEDEVGVDSNKLELDDTVKELGVGSGVLDGVSDDDTT